MRDPIVIHVRVRSGPELDFSWPVPTRRENRRRCGQWRCTRQGGRQTLPLVFEGPKLSVKLLQFPVLLGLKGYHLLDVPIKIEQRKCN